MSASHEQIVQHLLFHKSIIDEQDAGSRIGEYLKMVEASHQGDHLVMSDPFDRTIALCLQLVLEEKMDPWNIDLARFAKLYVDRVKELPRVDLIGAGRLILMAWNILKMQSDAVVAAAEAERNRVEEESLAWDAIDTPEWMTDDADYAFTQHVLQTPGAPIDEKVRHRGDRKVTLMELVDALEAARQEAIEFQVISKRRAEERARWKVDSRASVGMMMHKEDLEDDIRNVWGRINTFNGHPIAFHDLHTDEREDFVQTLVSILFLTRDGMTRVWQEDFPYGDIFVQNLQPGADLPKLSLDDLRSAGQAKTEPDEPRADASPAAPTEPGAGPTPQEAMHHD